MLALAPLAGLYDPPVRRVLVLFALTVLVAAPAAAAGVTDHVQVRATGGNRMAVFAPGLQLVYVSPPDYRRGCCYDTNGGEWLGPLYTSTATGNSADSSIDWSYEPAFGAASAEAAARSASLGVPEDRTEVASGAAKVAHTVGGRAAGSIDAFFVITRLEFGGNARHYAAIAFPLRRGIHAVARFSLLSPVSDDHTVGGVLGSTWNRQQAEFALAGVSLAGSLPPARVSARAAGRKVRGEVRDYLGHPVAGATVRLERRDGNRWKSVGSVRSGANGSFSLGARQAGTYRAVASLQDVVARSSTVRVN